jgi:hypothetical protein
MLSFRNLSALYIFVVMFIVFSIWMPDMLLQWDTWKALLGSQAVTAILAIGAAAVRVEPDRRRGLTLLPMRGCRGGDRHPGRCDREAGADRGLDDHQRG